MNKLLELSQWLFEVEACPENRSKTAQIIFLNEFQPLPCTNVMFIDDNIWERTWIVLKVQFEVDASNPSGDGIIVKVDGETVSSISECKWYFVIWKRFSNS